MIKNKHFWESEYFVPSAVAAGLILLAVIVVTARYFRPIGRKDEFFTAADNGVLYASAEDSSDGGSSSAGAGSSSGAVSFSMNGNAGTSLKSSPVPQTGGNVKFTLTPEEHLAIEEDPAEEEYLPVPDSMAWYTYDFGGNEYTEATWCIEDGVLKIGADFKATSDTMRHAKIEFLLEGGECVFTDADGAPAAAADGSVNLLEHPLLRVTDAKGNSASYPVSCRHRDYGMPVLEVFTDSGQPVTDRYEYVPGSLELYGEDYSISVRGRGNASWDKFPQKSYMLKFDEKTSIYGMLECEKYVLASTSADPALIRNCVAMDIAAVMDNLEYTPEQIPVDLFMNGTYMGIYTLSEKIDVASDKISLFSKKSLDELNREDEKDIAFMLECGGDLFQQHVYGQEYFFTPHSPRLFFVYPEFDSPNDEDAKYIADYMNNLDRVLTSGGDYTEYIDTDSWVDWFIVMELTNNTDSSFVRSSFIYKRPGEKVMLGPVWDFDMAMGNFFGDNRTYEYWATAEQIYQMYQGNYMSFLYKNDSFMEAVRDRWDEKKDELKEVYTNSIDTYTASVSESRVYNSPLSWGYGSPAASVYMKSILDKRFNWIDTSLHTPGFNRKAPAFNLLISEDTPEELIEPLTDWAGNPVLDSYGNPIMIKIPVIKPEEEQRDEVIPGTDEAPIPDATEAPQ